LRRVPRAGREPGRAAGPRCVASRGGTVRLGTLAAAIALAHCRSLPDAASMSQEFVILGGARTPMAEYSGTPGHGLFKDLSALELGAIATRAALERTGVEPARVDGAFFGNALQTSNDAIYGARHVALKAGLPQETPCLTVN